MPYLYQFLSLLMVLLLALSPVQSIGGSAVRVLTIDEPPMNFIDGDGELKGISIDVVRELLHRVGESSDIEIVPWPRAYKLALTQPEVVLFTATRTAEREPLFHWIKRINRNPWVLYGHRDSPYRIDSLEQAKQLPAVGVLRGGVRDRFLRARGFNNLVASDSHLLNMKMLISGRLSALYYTDFGVAQSARAAGLPLQAFRPLYRSQTREAWILMSKAGTDPQRVKRWQQAAREMEQDGSFDRIAERWLRWLVDNYGLKGHVESGAVNFWTRSDGSAAFGAEAAPAGALSEPVTGAE